MGNCAARPQYAHQHYTNQPYTVQPGPFGGHYRGDFSMQQRPVRNVRFGADPPAWEFYRDAPPEDNLVNTMYYAPASAAHAYLAPRPDLRGYRRRR